MPRSEQRITIQAPDDTVWSILTNPHAWPAWFPDIDQVSGFNPSNSTIQLQQHGQPGRASIKHADKPQGVMVVNLVVDGQHTAHTFAIDRTGRLFGFDRTTTLSYMLEYDASGSFFQRGPANNNPADIRSVRHVLEQVKARAEAATRDE
jgi:carbon monoxide dehydrogenase subunit G